MSLSLALTLHVARCLRAVSNTDTTRLLGYTGYVTPEIIKEHVKGPSEKVKFYVCGKPLPPKYRTETRTNVDAFLIQPRTSGPSEGYRGLQRGMKQGALDGILKDLGYTEEHVSRVN